MVQQYPYLLKAFVHPESTYDEETGNYTPGEPEWVEIGKCRDESNGAGRKVTTEDGETYEFSWIVYAPLKTARIPYGTLIQVVDPNEDDFVRAEKPVLRFTKGQLNCKIWL